MTKNCK